MKKESSLVLLTSFVSLATSSPFGLLRKRNATKGGFPSPIAVSATESWDGIDGQWNTYALRIGTPPQAVKVLISTTSQQTWAIHPQGCSLDLPGLPKSQCATSRGGLYNSNQSSTYVNNGVYQLFIEGNLNYTGNGQFGYDTIGLGFNGEGGPTLEHQIIGAEATRSFWMGHFGIHPKTTNFTDFGQNVPSYMSTLKAQRMIPSVSWGYTQGAAYRFSKVPSSLTLGGFDKNRIVPNQVLFPMAADNDRDLLVNINNITTDGILAGDRNLLTTPIYAFIDSTIAEMWLPVSTCYFFEQAFNLTYDTNSTLYLVDDQHHNALIKLNPNVTFTLSPAPEYGKTVQITLPYAAFDLTARPPYRGLSSNQRYFPLRRAQNETQYTLGRTFLQEAYLTVDWERQNFYVSQVNWQAVQTPHVVPIDPIHGLGGGGFKNRFGTPKSLESGAIAGIVIAIIALAAIIITLSVLLFKSNKRSKREAALAKERELASKNTTDDGGSGKDAAVGAAAAIPTTTATGPAPKAELDASDDAQRKVFEKDIVEHHLGGSPVDGVGVQEAPTNPIFELPGDLPIDAEADGRELSEKEAMRVREARYNGVEPQTFYKPATPPVPRTHRIQPLAPLPAVIKMLSPQEKSALQKARRHSLIGPIPPPAHPPPKSPLPPTPASPIESEESGSPNSPRNPMIGRSRAASASQQSPVSPVTPGTATTVSAGSNHERLEQFVSPVSASEGRSLAAELIAARAGPSRSSNWHDGIQKSLAQNVTSNPDMSKVRKAEFLTAGDGKKPEKRSSDSKVDLTTGKKRFSWED